MSVGQIQVEEGLARGGAPQLLFVPEVAEQLRRSVDAVRWLIKTKQIRAAKVGGRVMVREADLNKFIEDAFAEAS